MFKSKKLNSEPPKSLSMQQIMEDMETFKVDKQPMNRTEIVKDLMLLREEDKKDMTLNQWWDLFELYQLQINDMEKLQKEIKEMKNRLKDEQSEIASARESILNEISMNLERIKEIKTPK
ncbi:unnamed protein product [Diamesa serratosioi]